jgi:hypothetical protein
MVIMEIEIKVVTDIYSPPNAKGVSKILKRNLKIKETINTNDIKSVREHVTPTGIIDKKKCAIVLLDGDEKYKVLDMPFEEAKFLKLNKTVVYGFKK